MNARVLLVPLATMALVGATGCEKPLADPALVDSLRVLAVRAQPPEVTPGTTVALDALVVSPGGPASMTWSTCAVDASVGEASCVEPARRTPLTTGTAAVMSIPANALDGASPQARAYGIPIYVALEVVSGSETLLAVKTIRVSESPTPNHNPGIAVAQVGTGAFPPAAGGDVEMRLQAASGAVETYQGATAIDTELLRVNWFVTEGTVDEDSTVPDASGNASTTWHRGSGAAPAAWMVLRDSRGGVDWRAFK